jgi:HAD superfamily hydrolase (TIGR01509 family)
MKILPRAPRAVVFDMDGLLFDTERLYQEAILTAAAELGVPMTVEVFRGFIGGSWVINRARMIDAYGEAYPCEALRDRWSSHFKLAIEKDVPLKPGALELLDLLDSIALPRAIATSSSRDTVRHHLGLHRLDGRFHHVVAAGDYERSKPAPDPFLAAARLLDVPPESCVALEDSYNGVRSAAAAGMMTIMVPDLLPATEEITGLSTHIARDLHEVRRLLAA